MTKRSAEFESTKLSLPINVIKSTELYGKCKILRGAHIKKKAFATGSISAFFLPRLTAVALLRSQLSAAMSAVFGVNAFSRIAS